MTHTCELTIRLGFLEGVGCGSGSVELTSVALAFIALLAFRFWLKSRERPSEPSRPKTPPDAMRNS